MNMARMNKTQLMNKVIEVTSNLKKGALSKEVTEELTYMIDLHTNHPKEVQPSDVKALIENLAKEGITITASSTSKKETTKKETTKKAKPTKKSTPAPADNKNVEVEASPEVKVEEKKAPKKKAPAKKVKADEPKAEEKPKPKAKPKAKAVKETDKADLDDAKGTMDLGTFNAIANNKLVKFKEYIFPQAYECELGLLERRDNLKTLKDINEEIEKGADLVIMTYWTDQHLASCDYDPYEINKTLPKSFKDDFDICQVVFSSEKVLYAISLETEVMSTFPAKSFKHKKGTNYRVSSGMEFEVYELRSK